MADLRPNPDLDAAFGKAAAGGFDIGAAYDDRATERAESNVEKVADKLLEAERRVIAQLRANPIRGESKKAEHDPLTERMEDLGREAWRKGLEEQERRKREEAKKTADEQALTERMAQLGVENWRKGLEEQRRRRAEEASQAQAKADEEASQAQAKADEERQKKEEHADRQRKTRMQAFVGYSRQALGSLPFVNGMANIANAGIHGGAGAAAAQAGAAFINYGFQGAGKANPAAMERLGYQSDRLQAIIGREFVPAVRAASTVIEKVADFFGGKGAQLNMPGISDFASVRDRLQMEALAGMPEGGETSVWNNPKTRGIGAGVGAGVGGTFGMLGGPLAPITVPAFARAGAWVGDKAEEGVNWAWKGIKRELSSNDGLIDAMDGLEGAVRKSHPPVPSGLPTYRGSMDALA
jgi:hypothetical protein